MPTSDDSIQSKLTNVTTSENPININKSSRMSFNQIKTAVSKYCQLDDSLHWT